MYRRILVPTDGSTVSARAERAAVEVARRFGAGIRAVHVVAPYSLQALGELGGQGPAPLSPEAYRKLAERRGRMALQRVARRAARAQVVASTTLLTDDDPGAALVRAASEQGCDLIVMGSSSRAGLERIFLGSVASNVVNGTRVPTLVCH